MKNKTVNRVANVVSFAEPKQETRTAMFLRLFKSGEYSDPTPRESRASQFVRLFNSGEYSAAQNLRS